MNQGTFKSSFEAITDGSHISAGKQCDQICWNIATLAKF